jgi:hypothetical protein
MPPSHSNPLPLTAVYQQQEDMTKLAADVGKECGDLVSRLDSDILRD